VFQGYATCIRRDIQFPGTVSMRGAMAPRLKKGVESGRRESQKELRRLGRRGRVADPAALSGPALAAEGR
jgi:hypothetical protein